MIFTMIRNAWPLLIQLAPFSIEMHSSKINIDKSAFSVDRDNIISVIQSNWKFEISLNARSFVRSIAHNGISVKQIATSFFEIYGNFNYQWQNGEPGERHSENETKCKRQHWRKLHQFSTSNVAFICPRKWLWPYSWLSVILNCGD